MRVKGEGLGRSPASLPTYEYVRRVLDECFNKLVYVLVYLHTSSSGCILLVDVMQLICTAAVVAPQVPGDAVSGTSLFCDFQHAAVATSATAVVTAKVEA